MLISDCEEQGRSVVVVLNRAFNLGSMMGAEVAHLFIDCGRLRILPQEILYLVQVSSRRCVVQRVHQGTKLVVSRDSLALQ